MTAALAYSRAGGRALQLPRLNRPRSRPWFAAPELADLAAIADFNRDRYAIPALPAGAMRAAPGAALLTKRACSFAEWCSVSAPGSVLRSYVDANGQWRSDLAANLPRFDWSHGRRQLALNGLSANLVPNSLGAGAAAGSPGVLPAGWFVQAAGLSISVVGSGAEDGLPFVDLRYQGVGTTNFGVASFGSVTGIAPATAHTVSAHLRLVGGSASGIQLSSLRFRYGLAGGGSTDVAASFLLADDALQRSRVAVSDIVAAAANGNGSVFVQFNWVVGTPLDFTLRVALPQLEAAPFASPAIPTAGTSVTRPAESAALSVAVATLLQRPAASVVIRGQSMLRARGILLGLAGQVALLRSSAARTEVASDGTAALLSGSGSNFATSSWAVGLSFDATGRSLVRDGADPSSDANAPPPERGSAWLGRSADGQNVGDGSYDWIGIAPSRLPNARLMQLCVPA